MVRVPRFAAQDGYEEDLENLAERLDARFREAAVAQAWPNDYGDVVGFKQAGQIGHATQGFSKWARQDSNLRPTDYESVSARFADLAEDPEDAFDLAFRVFITCHYLA